MSRRGRKTSRPGLARLLPVLLVVGCGDEGTLEPVRSVRIALESTGLPDDESAQYRIFLQDTIAIAHGAVAEGETDTVRVGSTDPLTVLWQDARVAMSGIEYVFGPIERRTLVDPLDADTTVAVLGSYALASGGFALTTPGIPAEASPDWWVWRGDSVLARGPLGSTGAVRRGDLPAGFAHLQLDTAYIELDGVGYAYTPPHRDIALTVQASLDLRAIDAPYALATSAMRLRPSGLPGGTVTICRITAVSGLHGVIAFTETGTVHTVGLIRPDSYVVTWDEATVDGITYLPDPASVPATLEARIEPYESDVVYTPKP